jgi:alcohol dehydrogenase class IV
MDAIVQAFESWTSRHATPFSRALSELALLRLLDALPAVCGGDWSRAGDLLSSSYLAGLALSHARLGVVHGLAHPLGARWHAAHGLVCAVCLPAALAFNRPAIAADLDALEAKLGEPFETRVQNLLGALKLKSPFRGQPLPLRDREAIVDEILASGSTAANPRPVTREDAAALLARIFANGNE